MSAVAREPGPPTRVASSFRDPAGFMFQRDGVLYRQVNASYRDDFEALVAAGLWTTLWDRGLLVRHDEVDPALAPGPDAHHVLRPERIPFISYPYEWCFSAYRDAALTTLEIQSEALAHGFVLKDASAYNVQFLDGRPVFIDTLSFERHREGEPWAAYGQFCRHFLAPLALMARRDVRLGTLMQGFLDGVPLDLAGTLLAASALRSPRLLMHIVLHARSQARYADRAAPGRNPARRRRPLRVGKLALQGILDSLRGAVQGLRWTPSGTEWSDYYAHTNYTDEAFEAKRQLVEQFVAAAAPRSVWDLGANTGAFSRLASRRGIPTIAFDIDPGAVELNYQRMRRDRETRLLPLVQDLTNPSPAIGWANAERDAFAARGPVDMAFALALVHHLAIGHNLPLERIAALLATLCHDAVIEFVPKDDSQVGRLLASRADIFPDYTPAGFEAAFATRFEIRERAPLPGSSRVLYWMRAR